MFSFSLTLTKGLFAVSAVTHSKEITFLPGEISHLQHPPRCRTTNTA